VKRPIARAELLVAAGVFVVLGAAPTVGDIGGCGATATDLNLTAFVQDRKNLDCQRCLDCGLYFPRPDGGYSDAGITYPACEGACDPNGSLNYPACHPLQHDGDVCLRALQAASCSDYATYMAPVGATTPTECDFCHGIDGGADAGAGP
jgi:hypothetical protein